MEKVLEIKTASQIKKNSENGVLEDIILTIAKDSDARIERNPEEIKSLVAEILGRIKEVLEEKGFTLDQLLDDDNEAVEDISINLDSGKIASVQSKIQKGSNGAELGLEAKIYSKQVFNLIQKNNKLEKENTTLIAEKEITTAQLKKSEAEKKHMEEKNEMSKTILSLIRHDTKGRGAETLLGQMTDGFIEPSVEIISSIKTELEKKNDTRLHWLALLSALNSNKQSPKEFNLTGPLFKQDITKRINSLTTNKEINFEITISDKIKGIPQNTDHDYVCGILGNILENAVKFTPENKKITIFVNENSENKNAVELIVENDGEGFPTEEIEIKSEMDTYLGHLNKGHEVLPKKGTKGERGSGRGLSLCLKVAKLFQNSGGNLRYENRTNDNGEITGARVIFSIPTETSSTMNEVDIPSLETN